jgi:chemotaxis protein methyltransferase CheR
MTAGDLRRIAARAQETLGLAISEDKRQMVYSRLSRRLRALGLPSFSAYLDLLESTAGAVEQELFANALTTNLTAFFREAHHFEHFERALLIPPAGDPSRRLRIWSAGCSTGEEAYSLAMVLHARAPALAGRDCRLLATDLDTEVLAFAARGVYGSDRLRGLPARFRTAQFLSSGEESAAVAEGVRRLVTFRTLNLVEPWPFKGAFDFIFCRNVLIYFSAAHKARAIERMAALLRPGGLLYLGHSETIRDAHPLLAAEGHTIYRRVGR